jgi:glycosyltransferase involved in cell wall biosynthesis
LPETVRELDPALIFGGITPYDIADGMVAALAGTLALPSPAACRGYAERFDWPLIAARVRRVYEEVA